MPKRRRHKPRISRKRRAGRSVAFAPAAGYLALVMIGAAGSALADRHCFPAQEAYFASRAPLLEPDRACRTALAEARRKLELALEDARICGCGELIERLEKLAADQETETCEAAAARVLAAGGDVNALIPECH